MSIFGRGAEPAPAPPPPVRPSTARRERQALRSMLNAPGRPIPPPPPPVRPVQLPLGGRSPLQGTEPVAGYRVPKMTPVNRRVAPGPGEPAAPAPAAPAPAQVIEENELWLNQEVAVDEVRAEEFFDAEGPVMEPVVDPDMDPVVDPDIDPLGNPDLDLDQLGEPDVDEVMDPDVDPIGDLFGDPVPAVNPVQIPVQIPAQNPAQNPAPVVRAPPAIRAPAPAPPAAPAIQPNGYHLNTII